MANNQYINKVVNGESGDVLIDLTADTITASALMQGYTAHDKSGAPIVGTSTGGSMVIRDEQDSHGGTIRHITAGSVVTGTVEITENGTYDVAQYADAEVSVPSSEPELQSKSATPSETAQTITPDSGYDGLSSVSVGAISSTYVGSGITRRSSSDLTASGATVTVPAGYYSAQGTKSVSSGTAGTPTATKGSVSNHSVSVTPSVTNTTGYITGGTKTGTAVTVSASELVSGTKSITENGTGIDVSEFAAVDVDVPSVSPTLITKSITQNGTYSASSDSADGYSSVTVNVSGGGGSGGDMSDPIRFFDYDGTLVASYSSVPDSLPSVPTHDKLTNGTWNYTLTQVQTQFNAMGTCDVGANYETVSGATEIDIELQDGRLHPYLSLAVNGTVSIDWGDNSTSTSTGTSLTSRKSDIHHEYAAAGSYTIKISLTSGTGYSLYCTSTYTLLNKNVSTANANRVYSSCVQSVRVGDDCTIGGSAFYYCQSLASVSFPSTVTSIGTYAFAYCYSLASVSFPSGVTSIEAFTFYYSYALASVSIPSTVTSIGNNAINFCYSLASVSIPSTVTSIGGSAFYYCQSLASVSIPSGVTSIGGGVFNNCLSLASVSIPSTVTSINTQAFYYCYGMAVYHFEPTTPPTLANVNAFTNIQSDCIIYVPAASLADYQTANNWSTYASYMVGE